jgi:hypothetical protein
VRAQVKDSASGCAHSTDCRQTSIPPHRLRWKCRIETSCCSLGPDVGLPPYPSPVVLLALERAAGDCVSLKPTSLRLYRRRTWPQLQSSVQLSPRGRGLRQPAVVWGAAGSALSYFILYPIEYICDTPALARYSKYADGGIAGQRAHRPPFVTRSTCSVLPPEYSTCASPRSAHRPSLCPTSLWPCRGPFQSQQFSPSRLRATSKRIPT